MSIQKLTTAYKFHLFPIAFITEYIWYLFSIIKPCLFSPRRHEGHEAFIERDFKLKKTVKINRNFFYSLGLRKATTVAVIPAMF